MERKNALYFVIPVFLTKTHQVDSLTERVLYACDKEKKIQTSRLQNQKKVPSDHCNF